MIWNEEQFKKQNLKKYRARESEYNGRGRVNNRQHPHTYTIHFGCIGT